MTLLCVQPFGVHSPGGGPRILRALLEDAPLPVLSVCTSPGAPVSGSRVPEVRLPLRPYLGRIESTRLNRLLGGVDLALASRFERRLGALLRRESVRAVHLVPHGLDAWPAWRATRRARLPCVISVHDDLRWVMRKRVGARRAERHLGTIWREAEHRFVISEAIGAEYARRYGERPFTLVTDGLSSVTPARERPAKRLTAYFMGAFHNSYWDNLLPFAEALEALQRARPELKVRLVMRCGTLPGALPLERVELDMRPFAGEKEIERDLREADVLWLPLPFGAEHETFVRLSLSTKLVTYLGSGVPILFHGPSESGAWQLLEDAEAGVGAFEPTAASARAALEEVSERGGEIARHAGTLAEREFMLDAIRERFWNGVPIASPSRHGAE